MIGSQINQYKIQEKIGSGGQGTVYKALDTKLNRTVVIKVLPPELTIKTANFKRFEREAQLCSQLDHPNICTIYDFHEANGVFYIAMQYVDGKNVRQLVGGRPLELKSALSIAIQVTDALVLRPFEKYHPSRHQGRQHYGNADGPGKDTRLRARQTARRRHGRQQPRRRQDTDHRAGNSLRDGHIRRARTGKRRTGRCTVRHLFDRRTFVRNAYRHMGLSGQDRYRRSPSGTVRNAEAARAAASAAAAAAASDDRR